MHRLRADNGGLKNFISRFGGILLVLAAFIAVYGVFTDTFLLMDNMILIMRQVATALLLALGLTIIMSAGSFDLSIGSTYGLTGVLAGMWALKGMPIWMILVLTSLIAMLIGLLNGVVITRTTVPAFIVTLGTQYIAKGASYLVSGSRNYSLIVDEFNAIGTKIVFGLPIQIYYAVVLVIILAILLNRTTLGRYIQATGSNRTAARFAGINTNRVVIFSHVLCALLAGFAGVVNTARLFNVSAANEANAIDSICAVVIGGTSMAGGNGTIIGTVFGAFVMTVMANGLNHMGVSPYWQQVIKGILIIAAVAFDGYRRISEQNAITRSIVKGDATKSKPEERARWLFKKKE